MYMMLDKLDQNAIQDENARELIRQLLNLVEKLSAALHDAQIVIQPLRSKGFSYLPLSITIIRLNAPAIYPSLPSVFDT